MRTRVIAILVTGAVGAFAPACRGGDCELSATCVASGATTSGPDASDVGDAGDANSDAPVGYPLVDPPNGCVADGDPKDASAAACVDNNYALFVDPTSGNDVNPGTRELPVHSIKGASNIDKLHGRPRIYVCAGTGNLDELVELPPNVSLIGGFKCGTWEYVGAPLPIIAPSLAGLATVHVLPATSLPITISDIEIRGAPGDDRFPSSIGLFTSRTKTTLRRVTVKANTSAVPTEWKDLTTNKLAGSLEGEGTISNTIVAPSKTCTCPILGATTGGKGGDFSSPGEQGTATPTGDPTQGGSGSSATCSPGGNGANGGAGVGGAAAGGAPGRIDPDRGWLGTEGAAGTPGNPGVGGGGGGGQSATRGGGGGCGGCGGNGGRGGRAGGSSIAVVAYEADLITFETMLTAEAGSNAANGEHGEMGADGGGGGLGGGGGCAGGLGGGGAGGGGGTGGTGGVSSGLARFHGNYFPDGKTTIQIKTNGSGGLLGTGGEGGLKSGARAPSGGNGQAGGTLFALHDIWELTE